jgi:hypothetical protein
MRVGPAMTESKACPRTPQEIPDSVQTSCRSIRARPCAVIDSLAILVRRHQLGG